MDEISKKDLLAETGISYGQLYRWKREGLIPEEWFVKRAAFTGQETYFPRERILERVGLILEMKDEQSLEDIRRSLEGGEGGELDGLIGEAVAAAESEGIQAGAVVFETNDGRHYILFGKDGKASADSGVKILQTLGEKEVRERVKALGKTEAVNLKENGGK
jgi:DNA-binding transcriptional MerR regulator